MAFEKQPFGNMPDGPPVDSYKLINNSGSYIEIINLGATITSIHVPDKAGNLSDVVLGYRDLEAYINDNAYMGAVIGRYANRIAGGRFVLNGKQYSLTVNNGPNHLHGGIKGFNTALWNAEIVPAESGDAIRLIFVSLDGEENYPGTVTVLVTYSFTDTNELIILYHAETDQDTVLNLTQHSYFNLAGEGNGDHLDHEMMINADHFTPIDENSIPTGEIRPVSGTAMDLRLPAAIGDRIDTQYEQLTLGSGYDHNYVLNGTPGECRLAARVKERSTGRIMEVFTTQPGMQFYSGNFLDGQIGKSGKPYHKHAGFCLETQHFPDSPNKPHFPSTVLKPGQTYNQKTMYKFHIG